MEDNIAIVGDVHMHGEHSEMHRIFANVSAKETRILDAGLTAGKSIGQRVGKQCTNQELMGQVISMDDPQIFVDDLLASEPRRDDTDVCSRHGKEVDARGKCELCYLLSSRNVKHSRGRF